MIAMKNATHTCVKKKSPFSLKLLMVVCLFLASYTVSAQQWPFEFWHEGRIVLLEGDTLKGKIKYDLQQDLVQYIISNEQATVYTARKVIFFEIFDETVHRYRQFFALPYSATPSYRTTVFFELMVEGKLTLLTREYLEQRTYSSPYYFGASYSRLILAHKYFFLDEKGSITEFTGGKNELLTLMGRKSDDVDKFIKSNRLKVDDKNDFARIVVYYNSLFGT